MSSLKKETQTKAQIPQAEPIQTETVQAETIQASRTRRRIYLNDGWDFTKAYEEGLHQGDYSAEKLESVRLPHTTAETPFHYFDESIYQAISGYRRVFTPEENWRGKTVLLTVEAAGHQAEVFLNGQSLLVHNCGYTAFQINLEPHVKWGEENILVIKVDSNETLNMPPFGHVIDYMTYGGLYREVYLDICPAVYISDVFAKVSDVRPVSVNRGGGVTVTSGVAADDIVIAQIGDAVLDCEITMGGNVSKCSGSFGSDASASVDVKNVPLQIRQSLHTPDGEVVVQFSMGETKHNLKNVKLWSPDSPALYILRTEMYEGEKLLDIQQTRIGIREIDFKADGLYINGKKEKIRGLNRHQCFPYVGYAMPKSMQRKDAEILKEELGVNAVRTSHYPQSHYFLDRCDELGLLVFTEIPGWQHIGDEAWKAQAVKNTEEMVLQYRNHPSIFVWGVRINESMDDDTFYQKTNDTAHRLDSTRPTSGVRFIQNSSLLEDVYSYNDFSHDGTNEGCMKKGKVTPDKTKGYLVSEYNGHMFPTKSFDSEEHRVEHLLRHAKVMDAWYGQEDIAGGFGWCMFDYNTHKDFGSGDRICYHGVMDMFRNPKLAAALYASQAENGQAKNGLAEKTVLEMSSSMDIGEHPACLMKEVYAVTNADSVRVYKNNKFVGEFDRSGSPYKNLPKGPILIDDFIGELMEKGEGFSHKKAEEVKQILLVANKYGLAHLPLKIKLLAAKCIVFRGMSMGDAVELYNKYVGNWGGTSTSYRFEAVRDGKVVAVSEKGTMKQVKLETDVSHTNLVEENTYDVAAVRIRAVSADKAGKAGVTSSNTTYGTTGNLLNFYQEALQLETEGDIALIGPSIITLKGGMGGTYIKTVGRDGKGILRIKGSDVETVEIHFGVERK